MSVLSEEYSFVLCNVFPAKAYVLWSLVTDISDIHSVASDHSNRSHDKKKSSRSRSPDRRSEPSDHSRHSPPQISNGRSVLVLSLSLYLSSISNFPAAVLYRRRLIVLFFNTHVKVYPLFSPFICILIY